MSVVNIMKRINEENTILLTVQTVHNEKEKLKRIVSHKVNILLREFERKNVLTFELKEKIKRRAIAHCVTYHKTRNWQIKLHVQALIIKYIVVQKNDATSKYLKYKNLCKVLRNNKMKNACVNRFYICDCCDSKRDRFVDIQVHCSCAHSKI